MAKYFQPDTHSLTRREFLARSLAGAGAALALPAFRYPPRLSAPPGRPTETGATGLSQFDLDGRRCLLYVPQGYTAGRPTALSLMLHGATQRAELLIDMMRPHADQAGLAMLAVDSMDYTWDVMLLHVYGPDLQFIDAALAATFKRCAVDPARVGIAGFSDGASYGLAVGLSNGDLFTRVAALSPGFIPEWAPRKRPMIYQSHGVKDRILPIDRCGRPIHETLVKAKYDVEYHEFDGGHTVPPGIAIQAATWLGA